LSDDALPRSLLLYQKRKLSPTKKAAPKVATASWSGSSLRKVMITLAAAQLPRKTPNVAALFRAFAAKQIVLSHVIVWDFG
jgi:hypothetical protein